MAGEREKQIPKILIVDDEPATRALMRAMLAGNVTFPALWKNGALVGLSLHSAVYLAAGLGVFAWGYRTTRRKGILGHY